MSASTARRVGACSATATPTVLASSDREVSILAARQIPDAMTDKLDEIEVVIRPF